MTRQEMLDTLVCSYRPSTRYNEKFREAREVYSNACAAYDEVIYKDFGKELKNMNLDFNKTQIMVDGMLFNARDIEITSDYNGTTITASASINPFNRTTGKINYSGYRTTPTKLPTITNVIFNPPATIVFWSDKSKTVVKADYEYESYDPEKGIAMAIAKKLMGDNRGRYYEMFKHWRKKWDEQNISPNNSTITVKPTTESLD